MDEQKHSPGPWFVCGDEGHPHANPAWFEGRTIGDANGLRVADLTPPLKQDRIEGNARLIAAAPELLEAAKRALAYIESDEITHGRQFGEGNVIRAAIAKAEGRS